MSSRTLLLSLALAVPAAHATIVQTTNRLGADTTVSAPGLVDETNAGAVPFDRSTQSTGLGGQGQVSSTSAAQQVTFDGIDGITGRSDLTIALSAGVSGDASALHEAVFEVGERSAFSLTALFEAFGNGSSDSFISIGEILAGELLRFDLDASPGLAFSGFLDPGSYRLTVSNRLRSADPGEGGSNHLAFDFDLEGIGGGNAVPEPSSLALVLLGLWAARPRGARAQRVPWAISSRRRPATRCCSPATR